nr:holocyclotoxin 10 [Ixodes holocyclus]
MSKVTTIFIGALVLLLLIENGFACTTPGKKKCNAECTTHCDCKGGPTRDFGAGPVHCTKCTYQFKGGAYCKQ